MLLQVKDLIETLEKIEDKSLLVEVSTGSHKTNTGRFYGLLKRISIKQDYKGKRVLLTGELEEEEEKEEE